MQYQPGARATGCVTRRSRSGLVEPVGSLMNSMLLALTLATTLAAGPGGRGKEMPREPNPFAPSLPLLTDEEETRLDDVIGRFIQYDSGQLGGLEAARARREFDKLGP